MPGTGVPSKAVRIDGTSVGQVTISWEGDTANLTFSVEPGHLPAAARRALVSEAFRELPTQSVRRVRATLPLGDVDLLAAVTERVCQPRLRAAGGSCLLDAALTPAR